MLNRFKHIVEEMMGLIDETRSASSVLLAVSGGVDSMCLADLWVRVFGPERCAVAHCNFNLRGEDSDADQELVANWTHEHGVHLHQIAFNTMQHAAENGQSVEMAARELRYEWFGKLCQEYGYKAVVVAHHADDNAETMVLNMVRGAGLKGLTGMKPVSPLPSSTQICLFRPLLSFTRKQIEGYAFAWRVPYREDKTNASVEYRRNSIRHEVFPIFRRMNPSYVRTINREMAYLNDASAIVDEWCRAQMNSVICHDEQNDGAVTLRISSLMTIDRWRYLLYYILEPYGFNSAVLESLEALLLSDRTASGKRFEADEFVLNIERDLLVVKKKSDMIPAAGLEIFTQVPAPGTYHVCGHRITVETLPWTSGMSLRQSDGTIIIDASRLSFPFVLRGWRKGDWMIPLGMRGKKKLSDLFTDLKYGHQEKSAAVVVVDCKGNHAEKQHVAGVLPIRPDDNYKVTGQTKEIIRITITDNL